MEPSPSVKETLELGQALVERLNLSEGNDTLGKWMAHHLAELMVQAKRTKDAASRKSMEAEICGLVLKLWIHRGEFQNHINPLAPLTPILKVIQTLDADNHSWIPRGLSGEASGLYNVFRRLMIAAIFSKAKSNGADGVAQAKKTTKFQSNDEKAIIAGLGIWSDAFSPKPKMRVKVVYGDEEPDENQGEKSIEQVTQDVIAEARLALDKFENELSAPKPTSEGRKASTKTKKRGK
jgi:hypothetical protein